MLYKGLERGRPRWLWFHSSEPGSLDDHDELAHEAAMAIRHKKKSRLFRLTTWGKALLFFSAVILFAAMTTGRNVVYLFFSLMVSFMLLSSILATISLFRLRLSRLVPQHIFAGSVSAAVWDAEVHLELAVFDTPEAQPDGGLFGKEDLVGKGVFGASYTFDVGNGLTLLGEYHYSGFGVKNIENAVSRLTDPAFQERYLRGDTQILGRHAIGLQLAYPINHTWTGALLALQSPVDGSGVVAPSLNWDFAENVSLVASGFIPWGEQPSDGRLTSEYGATPTSLFLQLNMYF